MLKKYRKTWNGLVKVKNELGMHIPGARHHTSNFERKSDAVRRIKWLLKEIRSRL